MPHRETKTSTTEGDVSRCSVEVWVDVRFRPFASNAGCTPNVIHSTRSTVAFQFYANSQESIPILRKKPGPSCEQLIKPNRLGLQPESVHEVELPTTP